MVRIVIIAELHWSVDRVHKGIEKVLGDDYTFIYYDCMRFHLDQLLNDIENSDIVITTLNLHGDMLNFLKQDAHRRKVVMVCHGYPEYNGVSLGAHSIFTYSVTSTVLLPYLNSRIQNPIYLTPNGIDPSDFEYRERNGKIESMGWCGVAGVASKRLEMAREISQASDVPLKIATSIPYEQMKDWYQSIDLFIVTSGPDTDAESGPLPPLEAIVSGIPAIGTVVGNFSLVPGPKFTTIEEAVDIINHLKSDPQEAKRIAKEQYEWVMNNWTYDVLKHHWIKMFNTIIESNSKM